MIAVDTIIYHLVMSKELLKMLICSGFTYETWWFPIVLLVYRRVIRTVILNHQT